MIDRICKKTSFENGHPPADVEKDQVVSITGQGCPRGRQYVLQELTAPARTIASVRLTKPVPKDRIFHVMDAIRNVVLTAPVSAGTVVLRGVCCTDSDVIITKNVPASPREYTGGRIR